MDSSVFDLRVMWLVRLMFGFYYEGRAISSRMYCLLIVVVLNVTFWFYSSLSWYLKLQVVVEYFANFLYTQIFKDASSLRYFLPTSVDTKPDGKRFLKLLDRTFKALMIIVAMSIVLNDFIIFLVRPDLWSSDFIAGSIITIVMTVVRNVAKMTYLLAFSLFSCRMRTLRKTLEKNGFRKDNPAGLTPSTFLENYMCTVEDFLDWTNENYILLLLNTVIAILTLFHTINHIIFGSKQSPISAGMIILLCIHLVMYSVFHVLPSVLMELGLGEQRIMKRWLANQMLAARTERDRAQISAVLTFVSRERWTGGVWRVLPCGVQYSVQVATLAIAYLIDYLQLTNYFD